MGGEALRSSLHDLDPLGLPRNVGLYQSVLLQQV